MKHEPRRLAIVGFGSIGRQHREALARVAKKTEIVLVRGLGGVQPGKDQFSLETVYSLEDAINMGVEGAIIASPASAHISQARELLEAGIGLLIEKPLSDQLGDAVDFALFSGQKKAVCLIGYLLRYSTAAADFKRMLDDELGEILHVQVECGSYLPDWRPHIDYRKAVSAQRHLGGGVLLELSHEIDYLNWLFGPFSSVSGYLGHSGCFEIDVEDSADVVIRTESGKSINLHLDFNRRHRRRFCIVQAENGELVWDINDQTLTWNPASGAKIETRYEISKENLLDKQISHFLDCLAGKDLPRVGLDDGIEVLHVVDAIRRSDMERRWVDLR